MDPARALSADEVVKVREAFVGFGVRVDGRMVGVRARERKEERRGERREDIGVWVGGIARVVVVGWVSGGGMNCLQDWE